MTKYRWEMTCSGCPEQYDIYNKDDKQVAYFRLRHGYLSVDVPDCGGDTIFEHKFEQEYGSFPTIQMKEKFQKLVEVEIDAYYKEEKDEP